MRQQTVALAAAVIFVSRWVHNRRQHALPTPTRALDYDLASDGVNLHANVIFANASLLTKNDLELDSTPSHN